MKLKSVYIFIVAIAVSTVFFMWKLNSFYTREKTAHLNVQKHQQSLALKTSLASQLNQLKNTLSSYTGSIEESQINWVQLNSFFALGKATVSSVNGSYVVKSLFGKSGTSADKWDQVYIQKALRLSRHSGLPLHIQMFENNRADKFLVLVFSDSGFANNVVNKNTNQNFEVTFLVGDPFYFQKFFDSVRSSKVSHAYLTQDKVVLAHSESRYVGKKLAAFSAKDMIGLDEAAIRLTNTQLVSFIHSSVVVGWAVPYFMTAIILGVAFILMGLGLYFPMVMQKLTLQRSTEQSLMGQDWERNPAEFNLSNQTQAAAYPAAKSMDQDLTSPKLMPSGLAAHSLSNEKLFDNQSEKQVPTDSGLPEASHLPKPPKYPESLESLLKKSSAETSDFKIPLPLELEEQLKAEQRENASVGTETPVVLSEDFFEKKRIEGVGLVPIIVPEYLESEENKEAVVALDAEAINLSRELIGKLNGLEDDNSFEKTFEKKGVETKSLGIFKKEPVYSSIESVIKTSILSLEHRLKIKWAGSAKKKDWYDEDRICKAVENIVANAEEAGATSLAIEFHHDDKGLTLKFVDNGKGYDEKDESNLFDPYYTTKNRKVHRGLGLTEVKSVFEKYNGKVSISKNKRQSKNEDLFQENAATDLYKSDQFGNTKLDEADHGVTISVFFKDEGLEAQESSQIEVNDILDLELQLDEYAKELEDEVKKIEIAPEVKKPVVNKSPRISMQAKPKEIDALEVVIRKPSTSDSGDMEKN